MTIGAFAFSAAPHVALIRAMQRNNTQVQEQIVSLCEPKQILSDAEFYFIFSILVLLMLIASIWIWTENHTR